VELSTEQAADMLKLNCFYCKGPPNMPFNSIIGRRKSGMIASGMSQEHINDALVLYNGIDRIDSDKGYTSNNTVSCCKTCNFAKNELTTQEFYDWVQRIHKNFKI
jgi:hypothetical protein